MSFVSIVATVDFINVCTDGRRVNNGKPVQEDVQKFNKIDDNIFVAFAGEVFPCLVGAEKMTDIIRSNPEVPLLDVVPSFKEMVSKKFQGMLAQFSVGGINKANEVEFFVFSVTQDIQHYKPKNKNDINYGFLYRSMAEEKIGFGGLEAKLISSIKKTDKQHKSARDVLLAQQLLNDFVAEHDDSVNNRTFTLTLKKRR